MTKRQEKILNAIIKEYVKSSKPVSSKSLIDKLDLSSATIRNEMKELEGSGYLIQPHISAGRIPTEKSYRFFIKSLDKTDVSVESSEDTFEKHFNNLFEQVGENETKVFVGKEIPLVKRKFTVIITNYRVSEKKQEVIGFLGPTRMRYDYNISLINKLREMMENYE